MAANSLQPAQHHHSFTESDVETENTKLDSHASPPQKPYSSWNRLHHKASHKLVNNFLPAYFVNVMATGISAAICYHFPYPAAWLRVVGLILWALGIFFFLCGTVLMVISASTVRGNLVKFHTDPKVAPFMGCFAMGYNSMVNMLYFVTGPSFIIGIFVLWWVSVFLCVYTAVVIFYFTFLVKTSTKKHFSPENFHATLLLPIVALTVTSSAGQLFAMDLPHRNLQVLTVVVSYVLWANAMAMSFIVLSLIFYKYLVHKIPNTTMVFTTFIPIGFLGQGAFSILLCGNNLHQLVPAMAAKLAGLEFTHNMGQTLSEAATSIATVLMVVCSLTGLFLISFGYFNTCIAVASVLTKVLTKNPNPEHVCTSGPFEGMIRFNKGFWAMTFPLGTMAISNSELGKMYGMETFKAVGAVYGVATVVVTVGCCLGFLYHLARDVVECFTEEAH
ncbi:Plasma membrane sulfite pump involved in sulfite metabolism [Yamadazyma tenuis]|uniref:Sulfite efflux pump SSU1 n=1 Tax=Candida tenuis (strain ATCC 10573 / BCRC 21748 / CBS 615 / JCM 9827 / NBRC 10315 / NRRL Y-1498 / VKM Y-70) TaxID=590646 RepID=G3AZB8_CANTC|nr:uncharacterized protein CANTEDRAFT_112918 [Yamadazyma tenuis ATCC 10573]XP_006684869.1 uncharacterized protein CANTEDRAFT_112918 [Yamadazyma tenuis ATCC 10573]EGV66294.1 hypothetical protein CANTEDRAFT_112918 [Yamadazyma tenuis ATCC 10573]EGV66295.1 hypothetical protein CANTEDRAFT_112918 [Yamadazyma tenuis ATCC 10573]WEJ95599.1 Plasma membrane sulfite pump involved in sulfite metabolism [Yamadazyma tenuis]